MVRDAKHLEVAAFHAHDADCWHAPFSSMSEHASVDPVAVDAIDGRPWKLGDYEADPDDKPRSAGPASSLQLERAGAAVQDLLYALLMLDSLLDAGPPSSPQEMSNMGVYGSQCPALR